LLYPERPGRPDAVRLHIEIDALRRSMRHGDAAWRTRAYDELSAREHPVRPDQRASGETRNTRFHEALIGACDSQWTDAEHNRSRKEIRTPLL
jgi:DNA-binding GntR family transcriptional regulator